MYKHTRAYEKSLITSYPRRSKVQYSWKISPPATQCGLDNFFYYKKNLFHPHTANRLLLTRYVHCFMYIDRHYSYIYRCSCRHCVAIYMRR